MVKKVSELKKPKKLEILFRLSFLLYFAASLSDSYDIRIGELEGGGVAYLRKRK